MVSLRHILAGAALLAGCNASFDSIEKSSERADSSYYAVAEESVEQVMPQEEIWQEAVPQEQILPQEEPLIEAQIIAEPVVEPPFVAEPDRALVSQRVVINIPEYRLWLYNTYSDGNTEVDYEITIGVGRGYLYAPCPRGSYCTPPFSPIGEGWLHAKIPGIRIQYHKGPKEGQVVKWNSGFDEDGNFRREKIDYQNVMRGITTRVNVMQPNGRTELMHNYALHTTYDEFTVGMPSSGGCARVKKQEMLELFNRIAPETSKGVIPERIEIEFLYDVVQLDENNMLRLHANIYGRNIDWLDEIRHDMADRGFSCTLDESALEYRINEQDAEFHRVQQEIREIYTRDATENYVSRELKARLHAQWNLREFCLE
ncbi:MAG: L,D-transpeptidase [Nanoarchaeota archaeon]|nr:L,D-transpeptidase [Nanoarchaeota archaeon]